MQKLPLLMLSVIGACTAMYACGSSSDGDDDGIIPYDAGADVPFIPDTGIDGPAAAAGMGKAFCDATLGLIQNTIGQCCSPAEKSTALSLDLYKNIDTYLTSCETTLENSIGQRRTAPSPAQFTACENAYKAEFAIPPAADACQGLDAYRPGDVLSISCATAFVGTGVTDSPCSGAFDCTSGLACIGYAPGVDGKCEAPAPADGTCGPATSTTANAVDFVLPPVASCSGGFYCSGGTCKASLGTDAGCTSDPQCPSGGACLDTHCGAANADGTRLPTDSYCVASADCIEGDYCKSESHCPAADPCIPTEDGGAFPETTGVCTPSIATGACDATNAHECQGVCTSAACAKLCTWPSP